MGLYRRGKKYWFTIMVNGKRIQNPESLRPSVKALDDCYNFATIGDKDACNKDEKPNKINHGSG